MAHAGCDLTGDLIYETTPPDTVGGGGSDGGTGGEVNPQGGAGGTAGGMGGVATTDWVLHVGTGEEERLGGIAHDGSELIVAGEYFTEITLGGTTQTASGSERDIFVTRVDPTNGEPDAGTLPNLTSPNADTVGAVAVTSSGSVVLGGSYRDTLTLPTVALTNGNGRENGWVAQLASNLGNGEWSHELATSMFDLGFVRVRDLTVLDPMVYAVGYFGEYVTAGTGLTIDKGGTSCDDDVIFVSAHDGSQNGEVQWMASFGHTGFGVRPIGTTSNTTHLFIATEQTSPLNCVDAVGNANEVDFDSASVPDAGAGTDILIMAVDLATPAALGFAIGSDGDDRVGAIAADASRVYVAGLMAEAGSCASGGDAVGPGIFICSFDSTGAVVDTLALNSGSMPPQAMAIDGTTLYLAGNDPILVDFGDGAPRSGIYLARFDITGGMLTHEQTTHLDGDAVITELLPTADTLYVGGETEGHIELPARLIHTEGARDLFVAPFPR